MAECRGDDDVTSGWRRRNIAQTHRRIVDNRKGEAAGALCGNIYTVPLLVDARGPVLAFASAIS